MKKSLVKEYESLIRPHVSELYARAYAVKGNPAEAEVLTVDAIVWGASKFSGLANKERVIDLISARIGDGSHEGMEFTNEENMISRTMERIRLKGKLKSLVWGVVSCVLVLAILGVSIPRLPIDDLIPTGTSETTTQTDAEGNVIQPVIGAVSMKNTKTIQGDNKIVSLENYHNLSKMLQKNTAPKIMSSDIYTEIERYAASVTAPDGTTYVAFNNITNEKAGNIMFDLYRMETNGWNKIAEGESQVYHSNGTFNSYYASRIYLVADKSSNIYVFVLLDESITIYKYHSKNGNFVKLDATLLSSSPNNVTTFCVYYDEAYGEQGGIYVGYSQKNKYHFSCYDISQNKYVSIADKVCSSTETRMMFCVQNAIIHMVTQVGDTLKYYRVESDGTYKSMTLFTGSLYGDGENIINRNCGSGGLAIDKNGALHVIATHASYQNKTDLYSIVHYKIMFDMTYEKETLSKLYYKDTDGYDQMGVGVITGANNEIFYIEKYKAVGVDSMNVLAIGQLNEDGTVTCLDIFELPNAITRGGARLMDDIMIFYSDNDIYYFSLNNKK